mmetsp:Transcript_25207/g.42282  ORF Transcript_25207/g.42282 Transcript_25207/m.42282 type:complete len:107 (-) Transcript_25207:71-391(-)
MVFFCPRCSNMLLVEVQSKTWFFCPTCSYICPISRKITKKQVLKRKKADEIFVEDMSTAPTTHATCEKCGHDQAYYKQIQTRSADEPMTVFYTCQNAKCRHTWKSD